jgi:hypothetical protein
MGFFLWTDNLWSGMRTIRENCNEITNAGQMNIEIGILNHGSSCMDTIVEKTTKKTRRNEMRNPMMIDCFNLISSLSASIQVPIS